MTAQAIYNDHLDLLNIGVFTHAQIDTALGIFSAHIADSTIHFTEGSIVHANIGGLAADDHLQYLLLAGRAGGQSGFGGTVNTDDLTFAANTIGTGAGRIRMNSPFVLGSYSQTTALYAFTYTAAETFGPATFVGGGMSFSPVISRTAPVFIFEGVRTAPIITSNVNNGFLQTLTALQCLPWMVAGVTGTHNPINCTGVNMAARSIHPYTGTRTTGDMIGLAAQPLIETQTTGTMRVNRMTGVVFQPQWATTLGSTADFGTLRGLWCKQPAKVLFGGTAGVEIFDAYYGVDCNDMFITDGVVNSEIAVVRSALTPKTNNYFLLNNGGAHSDLGTGDLLNCGDITAETLITTSFQWINSGTAAMIYGILQQSRFRHETTVTNTPGDVFTHEWRLGQKSYTKYYPTNHYWTWGHDEGNQSAGNGAGVQIAYDKIAFSKVFTGDPALNVNNFFVYFGGEDGRLVNAAGSYNDVWWTSGGTIDVNGLAMTDVNGMRIDTFVTALNGGSVADQTSLFVAGMPFTGGAATRRQAVRINGRTRVDGLMNYNEASLAQLTANVIALALPVTNSGRFMILQDADALGPWAIQGIVNDQPGDAFYIINNGTNAFTLNHQDVAAAAANRIISPTGVNLLLGPDEMAKLWYDPVATRWRILETTGA